MHLFSFLYRTLITVFLTLIVLIMMRYSSSFKNAFYQKVYEENFPFVKVNEWYQSLFGSSFPFQKYMKTQTVFKETLSYSSLEAYLDGVKLSVDENYPIPVLQEGLVVFIGEKEGYGTVVMIEQLDGVDCWYGNLSSTNVNLYDYVEVGSLLGVSENYLYLVYKKEGEVIPYETYIS